MDFAIDRTSYPKAHRHPVGHGYGMRPSAPTSGVIHTTNNSQPTRFETEAAFLRDSPAVSAHYLISKAGQIVEFLDPEGYMAWHAGGRQQDGTWTAAPAFANPASWGIELHVSVGEVPTQPQKDACAWLCKQLMARFAIGTAQIETHRAIALPAHRKSDPEGWPDAEFYAWRASLGARRLRFKGWPIYQAQNLTGTLAGHLQPGETITIDKTYANGGGHMADGRGFIDLNFDALEEY